MILTKAKAMAAAALLAVTAVATAATPAPAATAKAHVAADTSTYTRDTLDLSGVWAFNYTFTQYKGQPVTQNPPPFSPDQSWYVNLVRMPTSELTSPPGNEPVYYGNWIDPVTGRTVAPGELIVSPFTSPRGIVLTIWAAGNPDTGFTDAYSATFAAHSANTTTQPLQFTGTWRDVDDNGGDLTSMQRIAPN